MAAPIDFHTQWRKSSFSGENVNCVEVAFGTWRKSSFSSQQVNCVEVAPWHKSSFSGDEVNCVEVEAWRKSSISGQEVNCVEVAFGAGVRDSKRPGAGHLTLPAVSYRELVAFARRA